ncbi:GNAT family N-acetyltransferase [Pedobacter sp. HMF7647]|uniref:GNAT family N-acetyltransferase n=1 Tax=Hufsiella arboris TaxID=2695275 RepID=A0A7K1Y790_9SPHI|nr:GNAT family N-acetyltransferase [Hufsiella arboris]MXV50436.1 GNAT family N-acetyltransferase [Hufsiella arboris]
MHYEFRKAETKDVNNIWDVLQQAIARRKEDGSRQWQDGYPNPEVVQSDIDKQAGFMLCDADTVIGYCAVFVNDEPAYEKIDGKWLTNGDFVAVHRVAVSDQYTGKGLAKIILRFVEEYAMSMQIVSIKADTNFDNPAMMKTFEKLGYSYCGEVYFRGGARRAYEKVLKPNFNL